MYLGQEDGLSELRIGSIHGLGPTRRDGWIGIEIFLGKQQKRETAIHRRFAKPIEWIGRCLLRNGRNFVAS